MGEGRDDRDKESQRSWMQDEDPDWADINPVDSSVNIKPTWHTQLPSMSSNGIQTEKQECVSVKIQTIERGHVGTQTGMDQAEEAPKAKITTGLGAFMERVFVEVEVEMKKVEEEHEVLEPLNRIVDEQQEPAVCLFDLSAFQDPSTQFTTSAAAAARSKLVVTSLSWSSTGQTIAAAYGRYDIPGWCEDRGALATWNLARESVNQNKPDMTIDVDNCLMCCAFHPEHPALIAGGTFNGDIYIWDLSLEGDVQRSKSDALSDLRHREPIKSMVWQYSTTEYNKYGNKAQAYRLVTLGADGLVMVWTWHKLQQALFGYRLLWPQPGSNLKVVHGGSSMSLQGGLGQKLDSGIATFMVGTEGGKVFRCLMELNDTNLKEFSKAAATGERVELRSPIKEADYKAHAGSVYGLDCSPFQNDLFLTAGYDGSIHLYHSLKQQHLMEVVPSSRPLHAVQWSPFRPLVFAAVAGDGRAYVYDLLRVKSMVTPILAIDASGPDGAPVYACAFNGKRPDMFATGGAKGIQIWRLPDTLGGVRKGEEGILRRLATADDFEEALRKIQQSRAV